MMLAAQELARFSGFRLWEPKLGDFIVYHGWFYDRWFGVISSIDNGIASIITEGLPFLLFNLVPEEYTEHTKNVSIAKIKSSGGGKYAVLQNSVWYVNE